MTCTQATATSTSSSLRSLSCRATSSKSGSVSADSRRSTQLPPDAHSSSGCQDKAASACASRSSRSTDCSIPRDSSKLHGALEQWVPRPPDTQRSLGASNRLRPQPSTPAEPPLALQALHARSSFSSDMPMSARLHTPRQHQLVSLNANDGATRHDNSSTSTSARIDQKGDNCQESAFSTCRHLSAELLSRTVDYPPQDAGGLPLVGDSTNPDARVCASRKIGDTLGRGAEPSCASNAPVAPRLPAPMVDVQLQWPPRVGAGRQQQSVESLGGASNEEGYTLPLPDADLSAVETSVDLEEALHDIRLAHANADEPSTQEWLAGAVRITPQSQQSDRCPLADCNKKLGSESLHSPEMEFAATGIQAAVRGAQKRAQITRSAIQEAQSLRATVRTYERCVLPKLLIGNAVGQGGLRSEIAQLTAERDKLSEKLAQRDREVSEARQQAAVAEADCAALRLLLSDGEGARRRAPIDRRLGGA